MRPEHRVLAVGAAVGVLIGVAAVRSCAGQQTAAPGASQLTAPAVSTTAPAEPSQPADTGPPSSSPAAASTTRRPPLPTPAPTSPADVAGRWVAATCNYTWRAPYRQYADGRTAYATPGFARILAQGGAADWQRNVVDQRITSTCRILTTATITAAPNTASTAYIRVVVVQTLAPEGTAAAPANTGYPLRLTRTGGKWLVDGYAVGG